MLEYLNKVQSPWKSKLTSEKISQEEGIICNKKKEVGGEQLLSLEFEFDEEMQQGLGKEDSSKLLE